ncbi:MAG: LCP family protein [bacterium]|nr:LCP family protein [bacterium]
MSVRRRRLRRRRAVITAVIAGAALLAGVAWAWLPRLRSGGESVAGRIASRVVLGGRPVNVLLIANNARGVRAGDPLGLGTAAGQADVILLAHFAPDEHRIYAITIPRDTLVAQPGWHNSVPKIKTLFFMGDQESPPRGPQLLAAAVSRLTGMKVDGYVASNFAGFEQAVDLVGGLTIDVKKRLYDPRNSGADFRPGRQHMNGRQVLAFVRVRQNQAGNDYRVNDFQRMQAEVEVLGMLRNAILDPAKVGTVLPRFMGRMRHDIATDLPESELVRIGVAMAGAPVYQVPLGSLRDSMALAPAKLAGVNAQGRIDGDYYDVLDPAEIHARLAEFGSRGSSTGLPALPAPASVPITLYGSEHLALHLEHLGFAHLRRAGGPTQVDPVRVVYPAGHAAEGWAVARAIGQGNELVEPGEVTRVTVYE